MLFSVFFFLLTFIQIIDLLALSVDGLFAVNVLLLFFSRSVCPFSSLQWDTADAEIKTHLVRTQSSKILSIKSGVGQNISMHASPTARDFFLELISAFPVHSRSFFSLPFSSTSPEFILC